LDALPRDEATAFLGGLPGILSANRVLVTEGHEKSFDAIFYRWILQDAKIEIYPDGGCGDVVGIIKKSGLWSHISTSVELKGVIDLDFRDDEYLNSVRSEGIHLLRLHEAEAYLCVPEILCAIADRIGSQEKVVTAEEIRGQIFSALAEQKLLIAARRAFVRLRVSLAVSVERKMLAKATSVEELSQSIKDAASMELQKAHMKLSPDEVENVFKSEVETIDEVISQRDVERALRFLPAKELLNNLAPKAGCKNSSDLMRALRRNFRPEEFELTKHLSVELAKSTP
jgi:hypothetical protein